MKTFDKIAIIIGTISMALVLWHVFVPKTWQIDGFWGTPMIICMFLMGYGIACGQSIK